VDDLRPAPVELPAAASHLAAVSDANGGFHVRRSKIGNIGLSHFHLWTPPSRQGKRSGSLLARGRMLSSVRPLMRQNDGRRPVWEFADQVQITQACSRHCGKPWLSRPRLADCCAILSFRSPLRLAIAISLYRRDRNSVDAAFDQQSPDDAGHLVGQGDGYQHLRLASQHLRQP